MQFCPKCGLVCVTKREGGKTVLVCRKCGYRIEDCHPATITTEEPKEQDPKKEVVVIEEKTSLALPRTQERCSKCGNKEAVWWLKQMRAGDEPPTIFFRCTKCGHSWRKY
jgi:DNA-directed RNA polymerase subunit M